MFLASGSSRGKQPKWIAVAGTLLCVGVIGAAEGTAPTSQPSESAPAAASADKDAVTIENFSFKPAKLTVARGTTVTWTNHDDVPHTVTSKGDPQVFDSGALDTDEKFSFTFSKPGEFAYYCKVHTHMKGTVTVK